MFACRSRGEHTIKSKNFGSKSGTHDYYKLQNPSKIIKKTLKSCLNFEPYKITNKVLGKGSYGEVILACKQPENNCNFVGKIVDLRFSPHYDPVYRLNLFYTECMIADFAGKHKFGVPIRGYALCKQSKSPKSQTKDNNPEEQGIFATIMSWFSGNKDDFIPTDFNKSIKGLLIMDKYDSDLESDQTGIEFEDYVDLFKKIKTMHDYGILHRDLYTRNILYIKKKGADSLSQRPDLRIIDFGLSIPFEREIPGVFKAVDYLKLISGIDSHIIREQCQQHLHTILSSKDIETAGQWIKNHYHMCSSEYELIDFIPLKFYKYFGPLVDTFTVWSTRCSKQHDQQIDDIVKQKLETFT